MISKFFLLLLYLSFISHAKYTAVIQYCDIIEINHTYEDNGIIYDQVIFWEYKNGKKVVVDYRILECRRKCSEEEKAAQKDFYKKRHVKLPPDFKYTIWLGINIEKTDDGFYTFVFLDGIILRAVKATSLIESWTTRDDDPEILNQKIWPSYKRKKLVVPRNNTLEKDWYDEEQYDDYFKKSYQNGLFS